MDPLQERMQKILSGRSFAVVGASNNSEKAGYWVYRKLKEAGYAVFAVNPNRRVVQGDAAYPHLKALPQVVDCVVTVVPPPITRAAVAEAIEQGIQAVWMQPGSEDEAAVRLAEDRGLTAVYGGPCIMVQLSLRRSGSQV
ncbi:MAG: CoA-binding protein [Chthonomonadales bacterium]